MKEDRNFGEHLLEYNFEILREFVEVDLALKYIRLNDLDSEAPNWWDEWKEKIGIKWRRPDLGVRCLQNDMEVKFPDSDEEPMQAHIAKEIHSLYSWWIDVRANREDPYDNVFIDESRGIDVDEFEKAWNLEDKHLEEDDVMFMRLGSIRDHLWS